MTDTALRDRLLEKLSADDSATRRALVRISIDHALDRRLDEILEPDAVVRVIVDVLTEPNAMLLMTKHLRPGWDRHLARVTASGELVGEAIPEDTKERILSIADHAGKPDGAWTHGIVDSHLLKQLLAPVLQETLLSFTKRLPIPGIGGGGGGAAAAKVGALGGALFGGLAGQASKVLDVGKAVAGGIGAEMEKKMKDAAKDFANDAMDDLRGALRARLTSDEGKKILAELVSHGYDRVAKVKVADVMKDADVLPRAEVDALVARVAAHNGRRTALRAVIKEEVAAFFGVEGGKTVRQLAHELEVSNAVLALFEAHADDIAKGFFRNPAFVEWLDELLA